ncbi:xanthine dehydrogenase family protein molybdopterin-binding subunit [Xanthomonas campestris pv. raphani]|uniref:xanthine dehydrogenase family protein molybdopterin-binding subunit n=1 Tax=Xanthomonas campestris TaxID=339 RepID=UPI00021AF0AD|nr:xanthine dehydrogenase family protein molybdopterin-binding subunit [Xanthomonas campestris]AEL06206.1 hydroxylase large subunit [Xanthomonas campestris pv. raphani 756C]MEA9676410.1 xanthine dehydrogenase family protein molybdopterin-binding subunit [Xanthomonas campestris pv. raphani]MEA9776383.1 xanthine dehydrogenase family protein molybdopterin-binding subunit [Xanthomonas campestris pv. raphani]MEA9916924.1 xanthine dehydrogenase family protein molybdopterin-binding subunit [Xanthomona
MNARPDELIAPVADPGTGHRPTGTGMPRIDGRAKVTGQARYAAEWPVPDLAYGVVVNSSIAKGRIVAFDLEAARAVPGVLEIVTHENRPHMRGMDLFYKDMTAPAGSPFRPLYDNAILYSGQPIALVVAETFEAARHAAHLVQVEYASEPHDTNLMANLGRMHKPKPLKAGFSPPPKDKGEPDTAFVNAAHQIQADYYSAVEHHNPMELFASTVIRDAEGHFTIYDKTQGSQNSRWYVSHVFGLSKQKVTVRNPYVGGAFGSGLRPQYQLALAVMASILLDRSVRVVLTRQQMFTFGHRPETVQRLKLGADSDGTLRAIWHEAIAETSRIEDYVEVVVNWSGQLYACDNVHLSYNLVSLDQYTPIDMRAPGAAHGVHALEVAMDELSYEIGMDPLALRLKNYAEVNPADDKPYSSKALRECYQQGAERFGWAQRPLQPRARKEGREWVGWGMATGQWDAMQMFARAHAVLHADGRLVVSSAASDIGTGTYTVMAMIAAEALGLPMEQVTFQLGDSTLPVAPIEGGSSHVTTIGSAVDGACAKLRKRLLRLAQAMPDSRFAKAKPDDVVFANGTLALRADSSSAIALTQVLAEAKLEHIEDKFLLLPNVLKQRKYTRATHSAVFVEVRVDEELGTVRVTRVVSAIAAGRILNPTTARSQIIGGVVWGIGEALHEQTQSDHRFGRFMNHDLAMYHVSANADIHDIEVIFADEDDRVVSSLGAKGVGEIGLVGVSAAVCNAIFHATGKRVRSTPMTPDKVMAD